MVLPGLSNPDSSDPRYNVNPQRLNTFWGTFLTSPNRPLPHNAASTVRYDTMTSSVTAGAHPRYAGACPRPTHTPNQEHKRQLGAFKGGVGLFGAGFTKNYTPRRWNADTAGPPLKRGTIHREGAHALAIRHEPERQPQKGGGSYSQSRLKPSVSQ